MRKVSLAGENCFENESGQKISLAYYVLEEYRAVGERPLYGIQIVKRFEAGGQTVREKETAVAVSYSEVFVRQLLFDLIRNTVTPMCLFEIIDDRISIAEELDYSA